jgi:WD40 repeat protein
MSTTSKVSLRSRKSRIVLNSAAIKPKPSSINAADTPSSQSGLSKKTFSCLRFLWQQKYITLDDYLTACKYIELQEVVRKVMGCPKGFGHKVVWNNPFKTSHVSWIQSELSLIDQDYLQHCNDDELLALWKVLQKILNKMPLSFRTKFNDLLFADSINNFHTQQRVYLKAFQSAIPVIKAFLLEFWKKKSPRY